MANTRLADRNEPWSVSTRNSSARLTVRSHDAPAAVRPLPPRTPPAASRRLPRRAVAEQLSQGFLVPGDAVPLDQRDEILRRVAASAERQKCGLSDRNRSGAVPVLVKLQRPPPEIRIFAPASRRMLQHQHPPPALARGQRAHQARGAGAQDDHVIGGHGVRSCEIHMTTFDDQSR